MIRRENVSLYLSLLALHLSGIISLKTGTSPPSCLLLDNRLYIQYIDKLSFYPFLLLFKDKLPTRENQDLCIPMPCLCNGLMGKINVVLMGNYSTDSKGVRKREWFYYCFKIHLKKVKWKELFSRHIGIVLNFHKHNS